MIRFQRAQQVVSMSGICTNTKFHSLILSFALLLFGFNTPVVAGIVTSHDIINAQQGEPQRDKLLNLLARDDVQQALEIQGVDPVLARQRVASLTESELLAMSQDLDQLPAGGRLSTIEWLLIIIIILLII